MKNLMIFVDPKKDFNEEHKTLSKIQVDNSLELGWHPDDILVVTNFPWNYRGVYSFHVPDELYFPAWPRATKLPVINHLFRIGMINDQFWHHDFDAFQLHPMPTMKADFSCSIIESIDRKDCRWAAGSFFFREAMDEFQQIEDWMFDYQVDEETAMAQMYREGLISPEPLDLRWNIGIYDMDRNIERATKPIMLAHFHPSKPRHMRKFTNLVPERLKAIFRSYGIDTQESAHAA